jgi:ParB/RepB/Spo0J family partition protein
MTQLATPEVDVDKIDVEEGFNARSHMDEGGLEQLAASIDAAGIVQPIRIRPKKGGRFSLISGHRRLEGAKRAGVEKVPITLANGNARRDSLIENLHREELDPIDTATGLKELGEEQKLSTNKEIAAAVNKTVPWVGEHLRLLSLPAALHPYIAAGDVPIEAERLLRDIAKVSPRVAECICLVAKRDKVKGRQFVVRFDELFAAAAELKVKDRPTMLSVRGFALGDVVTDAKKRKELVARRDAVCDPYQRSENPMIRLEQAEVDAARAAGCLVEHQARRPGFVSTTAFVTDTDLAADLAERAIERIEKTAAKRAEEDAAWEARQAEAGSGATSKAESRKDKRAKAKKKAEKAEVFNDALSCNILKGRTAARRKQQSLARAKALATVFIYDNRDLAGRGLRLVLPQLRDTEVKTLKSGEERSKVKYADGEQCTAELRRRVDVARTSDEVVEVLAEALLAGILADEHELPQTKRIHWGTRVQSELEKTLASDIKALKPSRNARKES